MPVKQLRRISTRVAGVKLNKRGTRTRRGATCARCVVGAACVARCFQSAAPRAAGCIYREISGLPLAQWAPLVLGLSLSRQASKRLSKQLSLSVAVTGRATNCMGTERGGGVVGGSYGGKLGGVVK